MVHEVETELANPPSDGVSSLSFVGAASNLLLATSWDKSVRLYDCDNNVLRTQVALSSPVLSGALSSPVEAYGGTLEGGVHAVDLNTGVASQLGAHAGAVRCLAHSASLNAVVSGSWDKTVRLWDPRSRAQVGVLSLPDKVYTMDTRGDKLVVGTAGRHVWMYDVRNLDAAEQRRESSLKFQTRCVRINTSNDGYVLSSIDGRVAVEWFDPSPEAQSKKYAFKCHRQKVEGKDTIYPINAVAFHPVHGTFATGGCDGYVNIWDGAMKKRLCQFHKYPTSVSALAFSHDGGLLAVASSYTYEEGERDHPADAIYVRKVTVLETRPNAA